METTPLIKAVQSDDAAAVKRLLQSGADIEQPDQESHTPLMHAAERGNVEILQLLVEAGAQLDTRCGWDERTALQLAAYYGKEEAVLFLAACGAYYGPYGPDGYSPEDDARAGLHPELEKLLGNPAELARRAAEQKEHLAEIAREKERMAEQQRREAVETRLRHLKTVARRPRIGGGD